MFEVCAVVCARAVVALREDGAGFFSEQINPQLLILFHLNPCDSSLFLFISLCSIVCLCCVVLGCCCCCGDVGLRGGDSGATTEDRAARRRSVWKGTKYTNIVNTKHTTVNIK